MRKPYLAILATLLILALAVPAMAQNGPGAQGGPGRGPGPAGFLQNLPPEKRDAVVKILDAQRAKNFQTMQDLKVKRIQLEALNIDPKADQAAIDALVGEINAIKGGMFKERVAAQRKIFLETGVLLPMGGPGHGPGGKGCGARGMR